MGGCHVTIQLQVMSQCLVKVRGGFPEQKPA